MEAADQTRWCSGGCSSVCLNQMIVNFLGQRGVSGLRMNKERSTSHASSVRLLSTAVLDTSVSVVPSPPRVDEPALHPDFLCVAVIPVI